MVERGSDDWNYYLVDYVPLSINDYDFSRDIATGLLIIYVIGTVTLCLINTGAT